MTNPGMQPSEREPVMPDDAPVDAARRDRPR